MEEFEKYVEDVSFLINRTTDVNDRRLLIKSLEYASGHNVKVISKKIDDLSTLIKYKVKVIPMKELCRSLSRPTHNQKKFIHKKDGNKCANCFKELPKVFLQVDHIVPVSKGGLNIPDNLQLLCRDCNSIKANYLFNERASLK